MTKRYGGASYYTKLRKQVKAQQRQANTRARKLSKSVYGKGNYALKKNYTAGGFNLKGVNTVNGLRHQKAKVNKFLNSRTSTVGGAKHVIRNTMKNILNGGREFTQDQLTQVQAVIVDEGMGAQVVQNYFDVYYKVKDLMGVQHLSSAFSSTDIMRQIQEEIDSGDIIKDSTMTNDLETQPNGDTRVYTRTFVNLMDSSELALATLKGLKGM